VAKPVSSTDHNKILRVEMARPPTEPHGLQRSTTAFFDALELPEDTTLDLIWDTVWWRQVAYFATIAATTLLLVFPLWLDTEVPSILAYAIGAPFVDSLGGEFILRIFRAISDVLRPLALLVLQIGSGVLPKAAEPWINAYRGAPWALISLTLVVAGLLAWGSLLDRRIQDRALAAWNARWREARYQYFRKRFLLKAVVALMLTCIGVMGLLNWKIFFGMIYVVVMLLDTDMPEWKRLLELMFIILYLFMFLSFLTLSVGPIAGLVWVWSATNQSKQNGRELPGLALWVAHKLRSSTIVTGLATFYRYKLIPAVFAFTLGFAFIFGTNRFLFAILSLGGWVCKQSNTTSVYFDEVSLEVSIEKGCAHTGVTLIEGTRYQIRLSDPIGWGSVSLDRNKVQVDPDGLWTPLSGAPLLLLALPLRRDLGKAWFRPIIRIGAREYEEHMIGEGSFEFVAKQTGDLFFYVNDAVIGVPFFWDIFYWNNHGSAKLSIRRFQKP
jgi:hypothetical protein